MHKARGVLLTASNYIESEENEIKNTTLALNPSKIKHFCSQVIKALHEVESLIEEIEHDTH